MMKKRFGTAIFLDTNISYDNVRLFIHSDDFNLAVSHFASYEEFNFHLVKKNFTLYLFFSDDNKKIIDFLHEVCDDKSVVSIIITNDADIKAIRYIKAGADDVLDLKKVHTLPTMIFKELKRYSQKQIHNYLNYQLPDNSIDSELSNKTTLKRCIRSSNELGALFCVLDCIDNHLIFIKEVNSRKYIYANALYCNALKVKQDEIFGKTTYEILPEELATIIHKEEDILLKTQKDYFIVEDYKNPISDSQLVLSTKKTLIYDENDNPKYILGIMENITNRIEVQSELKKSSLRFSKIFHSSPIPITVNKAIDSTFVDFNQSFLDLVGYQYQELIGKNIVDMNIWLKETDRKNMVREVLTNGTVRNREVEVRSKSGLVKTLLLSMESIQFENDYFIITMGLDISEIKKASQMLEKSLERQQELNMLRNQFISMISHEFRTPLTTIMLSTDMLKRYGGNLTEEDKLKHFSRIQETVLRMTQLMENVLILGKMDSGKFDLHYDKVDLNAYCESISSNIEFNTGGLYKIIYKYHGTEDVTIIDENILGLIITNLLTNAIKYSPKLSSVEFDVWLNEKEIVLKVKDYGIGIPEDDLKKLFNEFFRASNVGSTAGYGLGLSIVRKCIDSCSGFVDIESKVNHGTIFTVTIPRIFKI